MIQPNFSLGDVKFGISSSDLIDSLYGKKVELLEWGEVGSE